MDEDRKELTKHLVVGIFTFLLFGASAVVVFFDIIDEFSKGEKIKYGSISIVLALIGLSYSVMVIRKIYNVYIKPRKYPDMSRSDKDINRERNVNRKLPGKDIYEVLSGVRRSQVLLCNILVVVMIILVTIVISLKITGEGGFDIRISLALSAVCIIISLLIAGKKEFRYVTVNEFKRKVEASGIDQVRLNADFMMASHFSGIRGSVFVGRDYMVIFFKDLCDVVRIEDIKQVECMHQISKINGSNMTVYFVKVELNSGKWYRFRIADQKETDLLTEKLRLLDINTVSDDVRN